MKTHTLKLNIKFCDAIFNGEKTFEVRYNDRNFQKGDHIKFIPVDDNGEPLCHYGKPLHHYISDKEYKITYVLKGWGLKDGYVALSIRELPLQNGAVKSDV